MITDIPQDEQDAVIRREIRIALKQIAEQRNKVKEALDQPDIQKACGDELEAFKTALGNS